MQDRKKIYSEQLYRFIRIPKNGILERKSTQPGM